MAIPAPLVERLQAALVRPRPPAQQGGPAAALLQLFGGQPAMTPPPMSGIGSVGENYQQQHVPVDITHPFRAPGAAAPSAPAGPSGVEDLAAHLAALRNAVHFAGTGEAASNMGSPAEHIYSQMQALRHNMHVAADAGHPHHHALGPAGRAEAVDSQLSALGHAVHTVGHVPHGGTGLPYRPPIRKGGMGIARAAAFRAA